MHFFAEAICILLRLYAGLCENIDHLSPVEAGAGTELGNKNINVFDEVVSKLIRFGLVSLLNLGSTCGAGKVLFWSSLRLYLLC